MVSMLFLHFERFFMTKHCLISSLREIYNGQKLTTKSFDMRYVSNKGNEVSFEFMSLTHVAFAANPAWPDEWSDFA